MTKKKKDKIKTAWKKHRPELERIADHIGKFIDKLKPSDITDLTALALSMYAGAKTAQKIGGNLGQQLIAAGTGALGLRLSLVEGGGIINGAQIAGLSILATYGLVGLVDWEDSTTENAAHNFTRSFKNLTGIDLEQPAGLPFKPPPIKFEMGQ